MIMDIALNGYTSLNASRDMSVEYLDNRAYFPESVLLSRN